MLKPVYTQKDFREGKVGVKFEGNRDYLRKIIDVCSKPIYKDDFVNKLEIGQIVSVKEDEAIFLYTLDYLNFEIPFVPEHEIYLAGTDIPKDEKGFPLRFSGGKDNSDVVASSQYYLIYQKKNCILNAVNSDDFIEFCKQLKIAKVKEKHIVEHNLSSDSLEKAFRFILPPKKKSAFRKLAFDLLSDEDVKEKVLTAKRFIEPRTPIGPFLKKLSEFNNETPTELQGVANIAKAFQATESLNDKIDVPKITDVVTKFVEEKLKYVSKILPDDYKKGYKEGIEHYLNELNIKEKDLQFDVTRTHEYVSPLRIERIINKKFIIKRQPQFFVTDSVVEYSKLITKFTPEAINAMIEDGFLEVDKEYVPGNNPKK